MVRCPQSFVHIVWIDRFNKFSTIQRAISNYVQNYYVKDAQIKTHSFIRSQHQVMVMHCTVCVYMYKFCTSNKINVYFKIAKNNLSDVKGTVFCKNRDTATCCMSLQILLTADVCTGVSIRAGGHDLVLHNNDKTILLLLF